MENFDWITALSSCSLGVVFEELRQQVKEDVEKAINRRPEGALYSFKFVSTSSQSFSVIVEGHKIRSTVWFALDDKAITVRGENDVPKFSATLTLNKDRECRAKINGEEYELWQLRKMALEKIFFGPY